MVCAPPRALIILSLASPASLLQGCPGPGCLGRVADAVACPAPAPACRIVQNLDAVRAADVVVCITGGDGGIASVVAGLVDSPVIALPTSSGYGTAFGGVAPLLTALNSSAPGVTVVNIDSGFGASMAAWRLLKNASKLRSAIAASN